MKYRSIPLLALAILCTATSIPAQETERGQLWDVQTMSVSPEHMDEFMGAVAMIKEAAQTADLAPEFAWHIWVRGFDVVVASPVENMADFDDPGAWMRQFAGTPGEAMLTEAFEKLSTEIKFTESTREIWVHEPAWSYIPATPAFETPSYAERHDFFVKAGMQEEFDGVAEDIMTFFSEVEGHYPVNGYRKMFGEVGRISFLVFNDGWGDFYGEHSIDAGIADSGRSGDWEALMERLRDCLSGSETTQMEYFVDLSYTGPSM